MKRQICNRRSFLQQTTLLNGGLAALPALARAEGDRVNDPVRLPVIGLGNKGGHHVQLLSALPEARITALCEADPQRLAPQVEQARRLARGSYRAPDTLPA